MKNLKDPIELNRKDCCIRIGKCGGKVVIRYYTDNSKKQLTSYGEDSLEPISDEEEDLEFDIDTVEELKSVIKCLYEKYSGVK